MARDNWSSRSTFILASIGSAVGLGNAWRFPGLAAKHGGGAFLLVYLVALFLLGIPLLAMEIAMGRRINQGVPGTLRTVNKKAEHIGWIAVSNGLFISVYYAVVFAWVILMFFLSFKFAGFTKAAGGGKAVFSTTNYHVFRSGICSARVRMRAEGVGARTKWYFWPNASVREFVCLLVAHKRKQAIILASLAAAYVALTLLMYR